MEAYNQSGSLVWVVSHDEVRALFFSPLETELLLPGGTPAGKKARLAFDRDGEWMRKDVLPSQYTAWDDVESFGITIGRKAYNQLFYTGAIGRQDASADLLVQEPALLGGGAYIRCDYPDPEEDTNSDFFPRLGCHSKGMQGDI
ncbi:MAG: hypothetical protein R6U32_01460 [Candidatus Woesearchaeota archaeon]